MKALRFAGPLAAICLFLTGALTPGQRSVATAASCSLDAATGTTIDREAFLSDGYGTRWNFPTNRLAYMRPDIGGYYRIFTLNPDRRDVRGLTRNLPDFPKKHQGAAYWHPSGRYVFFIAQKPEWSGPTLFGIPDYEALPGFGRHDDLWIATASGSRAWRLTNDPNTTNEGVLLPVVSPNGKRVAWASRQPDGKNYVLKVADFSETPEPHLTNVRSYQPGGAAYYEPGSFTGDSQSLMYTSDQDTHNFWESQIYRFDLASGKSTRLTSGNYYNEHPVVVETPGGEWVVYMSTKGVDRYPGHLLLGTDWYAMRSDGTRPKRLTTMNLRSKNNPENSGQMEVATTVAVSPSGTFMLGDVQDSLLKQTGFVRVVRFTCAP